MITTPFYHGLLRKYTIAFGACFSDLTLIRKDSADDEQQRFVVPIEYSPRETWVTRLREDPQMKQQFSTVLPRMAYEMLNMRYDPTRKLNSLNGRVRPLPNDATKAMRYFVGIPYVLTFSLYAITRSVEDANQIMEQVVPYFAPDYTLLVKTIPSLGVLDRMRIVMDGNPQWSDTWEGDGFAKTRDIILTFTFNISATFYGPMSDTPASLIRKVMVDLYEAPHDAVLTPALCVSSEAYEPVALEDADGLLLDESSLSTTDELSALVRVQVEPDPLDAAPFKPVNTTTTITDYTL